MKASRQRRKGKEDNCAHNAGHGEKERKKIQVVITLLGKEEKSRSPARAG